MAKGSDGGPAAEGIYPHFSPLALQKIERLKGYGLKEYGVAMRGLVSNGSRRVIVGANGNVRWLDGDKLFHDDADSPKDSPPE